MKLDLRIYKNSIPFIKFVIENKADHKDDIDVLSEAATAIHLPIIITLYYYAHLFGMTKKVEDKLKFLKEFYGVTEIIGLEDFVYV